MSKTEKYYGHCMKCVRQMEALDPSPLRRFVIAKRSITSIFDQLLEFVKEGSAFVEGDEG